MSLGQLASRPMTRRCLALLLLLAVTAPTPALAQGDGNNPFGPLPQVPQPAPEAPAPQPLKGKRDDDGLGGTAFWLIIGSTGLLFAAVVFLITRDMRRTVGKGRKHKRLRTGRPAAAGADALAGDARHRTGSQKAKAKAQLRAKTKAARKQRRRTRSR